MGIAALRHARELLEYAEREGAIDASQRARLRVMSVAIPVAIIAVVVLVAATS